MKKSTLNKVSTQLIPRHLMVKLLAIVCLLSTFTGCKKSGLFGGAGKPKIISVNVRDFNEIVLNDKVNLILTYDSIESVRLEAGENLLEDISISVSDGKLTVNDNTKYRWIRKLDYTINLYVNHTRLKRITYYGAGNITTTNTWKSEAFTIDSWTGIGTVDMNLESAYTVLNIRMANANFRLVGKSKLTSVYCADYGTLDLKEYQSEEMNIDYRSVRNSTIYVTKALKADLLYKGNVYYRGTPEIKSSFSNTGKLIALP